MINVAQRRREERGGEAPFSEASHALNLLCPGDFGCGVGPGDAPEGDQLADVAAACRVKEPIDGSVLAVAVEPRNRVVVGVGNLRLRIALKSTLGVRSSYPEREGVVWRCLQRGHRQGGPLEEIGRAHV